MFKPLVPSSTIIDSFDEERQAFVKGLLACSKKRKIWFALELPDAMQSLNCGRSRIIRALDYFAENQWMELKVSGLVHGYRRLKPFDDLEAMVQDFTQRTQQREDSEIARLDRFFELASATECQAGALSRYFGQPMESDCGCCSFCEGKGSLRFTALPLVEIDESIWKQASEVIAENRPVLDSPRIIARFLCGMTSPALTRAKLSRHKLFGSCSEVSFSKVMQRASK